MINFIKQKNRGPVRIAKRGGFTLVETLVAISIFTMSVLAMMVILGNSVSHLSYVKRKLTATYLAQEGIEYMRNLRDTYVLYPAVGEDGWVSFKSAVMSRCGGKGCYFDVADLNSLYGNHDQPITQVGAEHVGVTQCPLVGGTIPCPTFYYHPLTTGGYDYDNTSGQDSGIHLRILVIGDIDNLTNPDEVKVTSMVDWTQGSGTYYITLTESLFNWTK